MVVSVRGVGSGGVCKRRGQWWCLEEACAVVVSRRGVGSGGVCKRRGQWWCLAEWFYVLAVLLDSSAIVQDSSASSSVQRLPSFKYFPSGLKEDKGAAALLSCSTTVLHYCTAVLQHYCTAVQH